MVTVGLGLNLGVDRMAKKQTSSRIASLAAKIVNQIEMGHYIIYREVLEVCMSVLSQREKQEAKTRSNQNEKLRAVKSRKGRYNKRNPNARSK